jgi:isopenicillin N synthase-like dioxygenase
MLYAAVLTTVQIISCITGVLCEFRGSCLALFTPAICFRLLDGLANSLAIPPAYFRERFSAPMLFLRPLHYSSEISKPQEGLFAAGAHTDYGMFTILATDGCPGLQILHRRKWIDVPAIPGALIVNLGDMLERCEPV